MAITTPTVMVACLNACETLYGNAGSSSAGIDTICRPNPAAAGDVLPRTL